MKIDREILESIAAELNQVESFPEHLKEQGVCYEDLTAAIQAVIKAHDLPYEAGTGIFLGFIMGFEAAKRLEFEKTMEIE